MKHARFLICCALFLIFNAGCGGCGQDDPRDPSDMSSRPDDMGAGLGDMSPDLAAADMQRPGDDMSKPPGDMDAPDQAGPEDMSQDASIAITSPRGGMALDTAEFDLELSFDASALEEPSVTVSVANVPVLDSPVDTTQGSVTVLVSVPERSRALAAVIPVQVRLISGGEVAASDSVQVSYRPSRKVEEVLVGASKDPENARIERDGVHPVLVSADVVVTGETPTARAYDFLENYGQIWGITDPEKQLAVIDVVAASDAKYPEDSVRFVQMLGGAPVIDSEISVNLVGDLATFVTSTPMATPPAALSGDGATVEDLWNIPLPAAREAAWAAFPGVPKKHLKSARLRWIYREPLAPLDRGGAPLPARLEPVLVWQLHIIGELAGGGATHREFFVTAMGSTPEVIRHHEQLLDASSNADIMVFDGGGAKLDIECDYVLPDDFEGVQGPVEHVCDENACYINTPDTFFEILGGFHDTYRYYEETFSRRSWDGSDHPLFGVGGVAENNAAFNPNCGRMWFGDGVTDLDIVGHEFTHGVVFTHLRSEYRDAPGALNESLADLMGALVVQFEEGSWPCRWRFRNICMPVRDHVDQYCATSDASTRPECAEDHGMVHTNSGILNVVGSLLAIGGTHRTSTIRISPIGFDSLGHLLNDIIIRDLSRSSGLTSACRAMVERSRRWSNDTFREITPMDACQVRNACAVAGFNDSDTDCDGLLDQREDDDDGDSIPDTQDNCQGVWNTAQDDTDGDGKGDLCDSDIDNDDVDNEDDNCIFLQNFGQLDSNMNGVGDKCEDKDQDGVIDEIDNCPMVENSDQLDRDGDMTGDACDLDQDGDQVDNDVDNCPEFLNPGQVDSDSDGVGNPCDNCPADVNPDQEDLDGDGDGDVCDDDDDDDGVLDVDDNCPRVANGFQYDGDGNGIGTACDTAERADFLAGLLGAQVPLILEIAELERGFGVLFDVCAAGTCEALALTPYIQLTVLSDQIMGLYVLGAFGDVLGYGDVATPTGDGRFAGTVSVRIDSLDWALMDGNIPFVAPSLTLMPAVQKNAKGVLQFEMSMGYLQSAPPPTEICGDGQITGSETCDGANLGGETCESQNFRRGTLSCGFGCQLDTSACETCYDPAHCSTNACLSDGMCGVCSASKPCFAPYLCTNGECILN